MCHTSEFLEPLFTTMSQRIKEEARASNRIRGICRLHIKSPQLPCVLVIPQNYNCVKGCKF